MSEDRSIREIRLEKLQQLRDLGFDPYATEKFKIDHSVKHLLNEFDQLADLSESAKEDKPILSIAGRVVALREMGKAAFAHLSDGEDRIQLYIRKNDLDEWNENAWPAFKLVDIGDHLGVTGHLFTTKTGEKSLYVHTLTPLSKALHNLPLGKEKDGEQWYGLTDVDQRYRHRHLDLICNHEAREQLLNRSRIVSEVRRFFDYRGYLEVETPLLQLEAGGAAARPFLTHYNAYDIQVKLRISLELYLKRIICGDVPKVYEIGRVFRNEGVSNRHNPEFTLLEWYEAYANLEDMMTCVEDLFRHTISGIGKSHIQTKKVVSDWKVVANSNRKSYLAKHCTSNEQVREMPSDVLEVSEDSPLFSAPPVGWKLNNTIFDSNDEVIAPSARFFAEFTPKRGRDFWGPEGSVKFYVQESTWLFFVQIDNSENKPANELYAFGHSASGIYLISLAKLYREMIHASFEKELTLDFSKDWKRIDLLDELSQLTGVDIAGLTKDYHECLLTLNEIPPDTVSTVEDKSARASAYARLSHFEEVRLNALRDILHRIESATKKSDSFGGMIEKLLEELLEPSFQEPTFVVGYPIETSPLAKKDPNRPGFTRRFEGYVLGREVCNAFSEINDPIDQRERFEQQMGERDKGDDEAHPMDEQFIYALESGMPPTGGCGIGIDRLVMLLTGAEHLREILLFPMMRPELSHDNPED